MHCRTYTSNLSASQIDMIGDGAEDDSDREDLRDIADKDPHSKHNLATVSRQYLELISLHWKSVRYIVDTNRIQPRLKQFLRQMQVNLVEVQPVHRDMEMSNVWELVKSTGLVDHGPSFQPRLEKWLRGVELEKTMMNTKSFTGTMHCEAILLSLFLLHKAAKVNPEYLKFLETAQHSIPSAALDKFTRMGPPPRGVEAVLSRV